MQNYIFWLGFLNKTIYELLTEYETKNQSVNALVFERTLNVVSLKVYLYALFRFDIFICYLFLATTKLYFASYVVYGTLYRWQLKFFKKISKLLIKYFKDKQMNINPNKASYLVSSDSDIKNITMKRYQNVTNLVQILLLFDQNYVLIKMSFWAQG